MLDDNKCTTSYLHSNTTVIVTHVTNDQIGLRCMMLCIHGVATQHFSDRFFGFTERNLKDLLPSFRMCTRYSEFLCSKTIYSTQPETL